MTRNEWKSWAESLKPGDKVIVTGLKYTRVAAVEKITPAGWVRTDKGVFNQRDCDGEYHERGGYRLIEPCTEELLKEAEEQEREERARKSREITILNAKRTLNRLSYSCISYDFAVRFLSLYKEMQSKGEEET
jgi:hypothetical protein